jgi:murein DD-endopeptidase MepM/ murein hydrolase activator NlpD
LTRRPSPFGITAARVLCIGACLLLGACSALQGRSRRPEDSPGRWYTVDSGETLQEISRRSGVPEADLLEVNGLRDASQVVPGKTIFVLDGPAGRMPDRYQPQPVEQSPAMVASPGRPARFRWPVDTPRVTSTFGTRWGRPHEGIDLTAPIGTPVFAADAGEVVYSGARVRGYGNMIVLKHADELMTVYAHNSVLLVKVGERVGAGQRLGLTGQSGHVTGPHLHFEVRRGQTPRDPLPYLPEIRGLRPSPPIAREKGSPKS